jgi:hypothetical protein
MNKNLINKFCLYLWLTFSSPSFKLIFFLEMFILSTRKREKVTYCTILQNARHSKKEFSK